jgi:hypothetical protein
MGFIEKYAYKWLNKKAATISRRVKLPHPDSVKKVGVIWRPSENKAFGYLKQHFSQKQVIFRNICVDIENSNTEQLLNVITSKDLNWMGFPKHDKFEDFINTEFDLLLNVVINKSRPVSYITALSRAKFKIGCSPDDDNFFDLNIKINSKQDSLYLAEQQIFYLSQLNKITSI